MRFVIIHDNYIDIKMFRKKHYPTFLFSIFIQRDDFLFIIQEEGEEEELPNEQMEMDVEDEEEELYQPFAQDQEETKETEENEEDEEEEKAGSDMVGPSSMISSNVLYFNNDL